VKEPFEFFHKIPTNLIKMYLVDSLQSTHNKLSMWLNFPTNPQRTLKEPSGHIVIKLVGIL